MIVKFNFRHRALSILIVSLFGLMLMSTDDYAFADRRVPKHASRYRTSAHGTMVTHLPRGHKTVHVGKMKYFYHGGVFYKRGPSGYVVIAAPIGAVVVGLPAGFLTIAVNGSTCYAYAGIYYQKVPSGYVVVEPPPQAIVVRQTSPAVQSPPVVGGDVSVTVQKLNVRSGPGLSHSVIRQLHQGDVLVIHGYAPDWLYVKLPGGKFGWVMKIYTNHLPPASG